MQAAEFLNQLNFMHGFVRESKKKGVTVFKSGGDESVDQDCCTWEETQPRLKIQWPAIISYSAVVWRDKLRMEPLLILLLHIALGDIIDFYSLFLSL